MDAKVILEQILNSAKNLSAQGQDLAEEKLGIPESGGERDAMLSGMGKGALGAGALALLLGTSVGRRVTGSAIKLGGLAAIGTMVYKAYQNWQESSDSDPLDFGTSIGDLAPPQAESRSNVLLETMIAAAKADGHIDANELANIERQFDQLGLDSGGSEVIRSLLVTPVDIKKLAAKADSPEAAAEMYLISRLIIDLENEPERLYLQRLAAALELPSDLVSEIERQVIQA